MKNKEFDCVEFQRKIREEMLVSANYDLNSIAQNIQKSLKNDHFFDYLNSKKIISKNF